VAGHSKWANIQHRKGRQDEKRGKVWTRVIREIMVAARGGGADMNVNPRLRLAVDKAKAANMPADTIKRNIDKATGNLEGCDAVLCFRVHVGTSGEQCLQHGFVLRKM